MFNRHVASDGAVCFLINIEGVEMFPLSVGDWGIHRNQGKVKISSVTQKEVIYVNSRSDSFRISTARAHSMILPLPEEMDEKVDGLSENINRDFNFVRGGPQKSDSVLRWTAAH